jgi:hypothetical protein
MKYAAVVVALVLASWADVASAQSCHTGTPPRDPAPASQTAGVRVRIAGDFDLNETDTREIQAEAGKSYWLSAAGCPRMGRIRVAILDAAGKTVKVNEGFAPSLCFTPQSSGKYTVQVTALSLTGSNAWGSIDSGLSDSRCGSGSANQRPL